MSDKEIEKSPSYETAQTDVKKHIYVFLLSIYE